MAQNERLQRIGLRLLQTGDRVWVRLLSAGRTSWHGAIFFGFTRGCTEHVDIGLEQCKVVICFVIAHINHVWPYSEYPHKLEEAE